MPIVFEVYSHQTGATTGYWLQTGSVLVQSVDDSASEANGWTRVRVSDTQFLLIWMRYCQVARAEGDFTAYRYDTPLGA